MVNSANIHKGMRCNDFMVLQENGDTKHYNITQMNSIVSSSKKFFNLLCVQDSRTLHPHLIGEHVGRRQSLARDTLPKVALAPHRETSKRGRLCHHRHRSPHVTHSLDGRSGKRQDRLLEVPMVQLLRQRAIVEVSSGGGRCPPRQRLLARNPSNQSILLASHPCSRASQDGMQRCRAPDVGALSVRCSTR